MGTRIQSADIVTRLRRAFGLRGVISPDVEETVVPVAVIADLTEAPYGTEAARVLVGANAGAVAGQLAAVEFLFNDNILSSKAVAVLDRLVISTAGGGNQLCNFGWRLGLVAAAQRAQHAQFEPRVGAVNLVDLVQPTLLEAAGTNRAATGIGIVLATAVNVPTTVIELPLGGLLVRPTMAFIVECQALNVPLSAYVTGRVFNNLG